MSFLFKNYSLTCYSYTCSLGEIKLNSSDRNGVNKRNIHTKHSQKDNTGKSKLILK